MLVPQRFAGFSACPVRCAVVLADGCIETVHLIRHGAGNTVGSGATLRPLRRLGNRRFQPVFRCRRGWPLRASTRRAVRGTGRVRGSRDGWRGGWRGSRAHTTGSREAARSWGAGAREGKARPVAASWQNPHPRARRGLGITSDARAGCREWQCQRSATSALFTIRPARLSRKRGASRRRTRVSRPRVPTRRVRAR
jgi:hypothetical protein